MPIQQKFLAILSAIIWLNTSPVYAEDNKNYSLQQAIDYALTNNPNLQIMQDRIGQAQAQLGEALANFYPQVKSRLTYMHSDNPAHAFSMTISQRQLTLIGTDFNHPGGIDNYRPEITASLSLFRGGQDYYMSKAAELGVDAATQDQSAMRNQLIRIVSSTFYGYLAAVEAHKVAQRSIAAVDSELTQSRIRYDAGSALKSDVLSLEVQLAEAKDAEIQAANAIELARTGLKTLLGLNVNQLFNIDSSDKWDLPEQHTEFVDLLNKAIAQRPEIIAVNKRLAMAKRKLSAAQGAHLPKADAYVTYGSDSKDLDFSTNRDNVTAGFMVEMDIFSGFRDSEKIKKAEYHVAAAEKTVIHTHLQIENEVKTAHLRLTEALARLNVTAASVVAAEEALRMVKEQRNAGIVTVTRYIEAEVARDKSHSRSIAARFDALRAEAQLNQAIGFWK
jgi:outer membrane protein TolC